MPALRGRPPSSKSRSLHRRSDTTIRVAIRAGDILLSSQEPIGLSARNVLRGEITLLSTHGPTVVAAVEAGGVRFIVHLTPGGAEALQLHRGTRLWLVIKTYSCRLVSF